MNNKTRADVSFSDDYMSTFFGSEDELNFKIHDDNQYHFNFASIESNSISNNKSVVLNDTAKVSSFYIHVPGSFIEIQPLDVYIILAMIVFVLCSCLLCSLNFQFWRDRTSIVEVCKNTDSYEKLLVEKKVSFGSISETTYEIEGRFKKRLGGRIDHSLKTPEKHSKRRDSHGEALHTKIKEEESNEMDERNEFQHILLYDAYALEYPDDVQTRYDRSPDCVGCDRTKRKSSQGTLKASPGLMNLGGNWCH